MNLQKEIQERIWIAIQSTYEAQNYTGAILDAITLLMDVVRDKSGIRADGVSLIGQAFGGASPIIKVNKLQTDTEKDEQRGIDQILRGLYTAIRNPRSHEKRTDTKEFADSIVCFVDRLIGWIDKSKSPFDTNVLLERIFDEHFAPHSQYAELLADEVPVGKRLELLIRLFQQRNNKRGKTSNIVLFAETLFRLLTPDEAAQYYEVLSEGLSTTTSSDGWFPTIRLAAPHWEHCSQLARARAEHQLIDSISDGFDSDGLHSPGDLGTWASGIGKHFVLKKQLADALINKLRSEDPEVRAYVWKNFRDDLVACNPKPGYFLCQRIRELLKDGDIDTYSAMLLLRFDGCEKGWVDAFDDAYKKCPLYDEDIPF